MRKLVLTLFISLSAYVVSNAQTPYWEADLETGQGWYLEDNWFITYGKLQFYWSPQSNNFDLSALSPYVSLDDHVGELIVKQHLDVFTPTPDEYAEIWIKTGSEEFLVWDYSLNNGNWGPAYGEEISFDLEEFAGQTVQFKFRTYGNTTFNWNWWDVFEVKITAYYDNDLAVTAISGPSAIDVMESGNWEVDIFNSGLQEMVDFTVKVIDHKTGESIGSIEEINPLAPQESRTYTFDWMSNAAHNTVLYGVVESENDQFEGNNSSGACFVRIKPDIEFSVMVYDGDNGIQTIADPEKGDLIEADEGITRALDDAGIEYDYYTYLPDDLDTYDIVFATMGCFCVD